MPTRDGDNSGSAKPFLRWAGGKTWLLRHLPELLPKDGLGAFHEPFLGGGSVFFAAAPQGSAFLSDLNVQLIETYQSVRDNVEEVIELLGPYENTEDFYYKVRGDAPETATARAARFIYLNQTSFNGIYRVNLKGEYNVPYGHRNKGFLDERNLRAASARLATAKLDSADFDVVKERVKAGDFVFLDPPYTVSHSDNGFVKYNQKLFSLEDQSRLRDLIEFLSEVGVRYVLTNAAHSSVAELFDLGHRRLELGRSSRVGGKHARRGRFSEYVFTNVGLL